MNEEQIETVRQWVQLLERGDIPQSREALIDQNGFCCLGVLGMMAACTGRASDFQVIRRGGTEEFLEDALFRLLVGSDFPLTQNDLATYNDDGDSFEFIAETIKEDLARRLNVAL